MVDPPLPEEFDIIVIGTGMQHNYGKHCCPLI